MRIRKISLMVGFLLLIPEIAFADLSMALKEGTIFYDKHRKSVFIDNNIYDNELTQGGAYIRVKSGRWFLRADYDTVKTGDEFDNPSPLSYEGVHVRTNSLNGSLGYFLDDWIYVGGGLGIGLNRWKILSFAELPLELNYHSTLITTLYGGIEHEIYRNLYGFLEVRRSWENQRLRISEAPIEGLKEDGRTFRSGDIKEDISNTGIFVGLGFTF